MKFREYLESLDEALKIVKKAWNLTSLKYDVEINDKFDHNLLDRILERTSLKYNDFGKKLQTGINYIDKKNIHKTIMIGLHYTKSEFIVLFLVKPETNCLRICTVLDKDMIQKGTIKWEINEFNELIKNKIEWSLNECGPDLDNSVFIEPWKETIEVHYHFDDTINIEA